MYAELTNPGVQYTYGLPRVMTVEEAAEFLRVNVKTLYAAVESKAVPAIKIGKRVVILRDALLDSMRSKWRVLSSRKCENGGQGTFQVTGIAAFPEFPDDHYCACDQEAHLT